MDIMIKHGVGVAQYIRSTSPTHQCMRDVHTRVFVCEVMEEGLGDDCKYEGGRDKDGMPCGRGTMTFIDSGVRFEGRFANGIKAGKGCFHFPDGSSLTGYYSNDQLQGRGVYDYSDGRTMVAEYVQGVLCGPFTEYDHNGVVSVQGHHKDDKRTGYIKVYDDHGAILWGMVNEEECITGEAVVYVYPDLKHVLVGRFIDNVLCTAKWGTLTNTISDDVPEVAVNPDLSEPVVYDISTHDLLSKHPLQIDLYEQDKVYVSQSSIQGAGEGLFARQHLPSNTVVSFYNGVRLTHEEVDSREWSLNDCTITLNDEVVLDVPSEFTALDKYCASLGHKANHSALPNCEYVVYDHPRFGEIKAIKTIQEVDKGCELTCDYEYFHKQVGTGEDDLPKWFTKD